MNIHHRRLLTRCSEFRFGIVDISPAVRKLQCRFDGEILALCRSLPTSMQTDAMVHFMRHFRTAILPAFKFFNFYYPPSWSIVHWVVASMEGTRRLAAGDMADAVTAHAMALLLHPLDDHLIDGQVPASHLTLLIRSQSWMIMRTALDRLADGSERQQQTISRAIGNYYSAVCDRNTAGSLNGYCRAFRDQMATWLIVPAIIARKLNAPDRFTADILDAYGSFGIAWRLLDDIRDLAADLSTGGRTAIYASLPGEVKDVWHRAGAGNRHNRVAATSAVLDCIVQHRIVDRLAHRIRKELASAAAIAERWHMTGLAEELTGLAKPPGNG